MVKVTQVPSNLRATELERFLDELRGAIDTMALSRGNDPGQPPTSPLCLISGKLGRVLLFLLYVGLSRYVE